MSEIKFHLELTLPLERLTINEVIALFQQLLAQLIPQLVAAWLAVWQENELEQVLGPRWADQPQTTATWTCPGCQSTKGFERRGVRRRVLRHTSLGRIPFDLRRVTCQTCGATFAPFAQLLELAPYQVSTTEFRAYAVESVCQMSYARSASLVSQAPLTSPVSDAAIHGWVQAHGPQVQFDPTAAEGRSLILDGTRVKAGDNERGVALNLGVALTERTAAGGRPHLSKRVVAFGLDEAWAITLQPLAGVQPRSVHFDGDDDLVRALNQVGPDWPRQRCLWHLPNQLYYALHPDGLSKADCQPIQDRLEAILYDLTEFDLPLARAAYQALADELQLEGLDRAAGYLRAAQPDVFTYRQRPAGLFDDRVWSSDCHALLTTSPVEREMREIDRRTDNGARWSTPGVQNLIGLDLVRRFDRSQWHSLWQLPEPGQVDHSVFKVQVTVCPLSPNVTTT
jgi:hypothetical protein